MQMFWSGRLVYVSSVTHYPQSVEWFIFILRLALFSSLGTSEQNKKESSGVHTDVAE